MFENSKLTISTFPPSFKVAKRNISFDSNKSSRESLLRKRKKCSIIVWLICMLISLKSFTQPPQSDKDIFNHAIDKLNFTTIRFVLADDKQKQPAVDLANNLDKLNYDANLLVEKITEIYGPNSKTQELSIKISRHKNNFNERKPLQGQLDEVIDFIIEDRRLKSYLPQLQAALQSIQREMLDRDPVVSKSIAQTTSLNFASAAGASAAETTGTSTFLTVAVIIIGLISLLNFWLYLKMSKKRGSSHLNKEDTYKNVRQSIDFEIYPRLEKNNEALEKKIENLRKEVLAMLQDVKQPQHYKPAPVQQAKPVIEKAEVEQKIPVETYVEPGKVIELPVNKAIPAPTEPIKTLRKYADYPKENGFIISQLQDTSDRRSIYEITIPPNSEYAQFTIVDNKELHEYAIQNRERLLKDACDFEISSSQHTKIEVLKPGKLQKNGNTWQIRDKAQIKFV
jgi:hypothetical protein